MLGMLITLLMFIAAQRSVVPHYRFDTALDHMIPFMPYTWVCYILFFPLIVFAAVFATPCTFRAFQYAFTLAFFVSMTSFLLFPEDIPRPDPASIENAFLRERISRFWQIDLASNGLPSLHVSVTCLACRMHWSTSHRLSVGILGAAVCISTLTVKQHTLIDVAGGIVLAICCSATVAKWWQRDIAHAHS